MNRNLLYLVVLPLLTACFQYGSVQTAATNGKGRFEGGLEPGIRTVFEEEGAQPLRHLSASLRYGIHDRVDVGVRLGDNVYDLHGKVMFTKIDSPVLVSVAPALFIDDFGNFATNLPVLVGVPIGRHELTLGPRLLVSNNTITLGLENGEQLGLGSSLGFAARITRSFKLLPELTVIAGPQGSFTGDFKLGVLFGGRAFDK